MAKQPAAGCDCVDKVNTKLESVGFKLVQHMQINFSTRKGGMSGPVIEVQRSDKSKRGKIPVLPCAYCPFCGKKRPD